MSDKTIEQELEEIRQETDEIIEKEYEDKVIKHVEIDEFDFDDKTYYFEEEQDSIGQRIKRFFSMAGKSLTTEETDEIMASLDSAIDIWAENNDFDYERTAEAELHEGIEYLSEIKYEMSEDIEVSFEAKQYSKHDLNSDRVVVRPRFSTTSSEYIEEYRDLDAVIKNVEDRMDNVDLYIR